MIERKPGQRKTASFLGCYTDLRLISVVNRGSAAASNQLNTIKKNSEFQLVFEKGHSIHGKYLVVYFLHNSFDYNRFGFCAGKKLGSAVRRNRVKRRLREAVRRIVLPKGSAWDIILVARYPVLTADFKVISEEIEHILLKAKILTKSNKGETEDSRCEE